MKLKKEKIQDQTIIFTQPLAGEILSQIQTVDYLDAYFKQLQKAQSILEKLGSLAIIGTTNTEEEISLTLNYLKEVIAESGFIEKEDILSKVTGLLAKYLEWLAENSKLLCVYELRRAIEQNVLNYEELLSLCYFFSLTKSENIDETSKFEFLFSILRKNIDSRELETLLAYVLPFAETSPLSEKTQQTLIKFVDLTQQISTVGGFHQLVLNNYLEKARKLKEELTTDFWHKEVILAIANLDLEIQKHFQHFSLEKRHGLETCKELINQKFYTIDELEDGSKLNLEAACKLIEKAEQILSSDYSSHKKELIDIAKVLDVLDKTEQEYKKHQQAQTKENCLTTKKEDPEEKLKPLFEKLQNITPLDLDTQINLITQNIVLFLQRKQSSNQDTSTIDLTYSSLSLGQWEKFVLLSQGTLVKNSFYVQLYQLVRKTIALIAEMQETTAFLARETESNQNRYHSTKVVTYLLEQAQKVVHQIEDITQKAQQEDINLFINLNTIKHRLEQTLQKCWQQTSYSFPGITMSIA
jgi:hypothetical protein